MNSSRGKESNANINFINIILINLLLLFIVKFGHRILKNKAVNILSFVSGLYFLLKKCYKFLFKCFKSFLLIYFFNSLNTHIGSKRLVFIYLILLRNLHFKGVT